MHLKERGIILIPIDFTEQSLIAVKQSYNLAKYTHSKLVLLHVYEKSGDEQFDELKKLVKQTETESGVPCESINVKGNIYKETDRIADEIKATTIMVGLESHMRFTDLLLPSASQLVRTSPCPVITVRGKEHRDGCENILLPIDLSAETREKVDVAVQFAQYFGAAIRILSIFSLADSSYENRLLAYAHQVKQYIKSKGIACSNKSLASDSIPETVVGYANKIEADLIMIMNKPDLNIMERISGTDAMKIINISNIPVMTVNPMKRESLSHFGSGL